MCCPGKYFGIVICLYIIGLTGVKLCLLTSDFNSAARAINAAEDEVSRSFVKVSPADLNTTLRGRSSGPGAVVGAPVSAAVVGAPVSAAVVGARVSAAVVGARVVVAFGTPAKAKHEGWATLKGSYCVTFWDHTCF